MRMYSGQMPFGKYKGTPVDELPDDYLWFCNNNLIIDDLNLRADLREELNDRIEHGVYRGRCTLTASERDEITTPQMELLRRMQKDDSGLIAVGVEHLSIKSLRARGYAVCIPKKIGDKIVEVNYITDQGKAVFRST